MLPSASAKDKAERSLRLWFRNFKKQARKRNKPEEQVAQFREFEDSAWHVRLSNLRAWVEAHGGRHPKMWSKDRQERSLHHFLEDLLCSHREGSLSSAKSEQV